MQSLINKAMADELIVKEGITEEYIKTVIDSLTSEGQSFSSIAQSAKMPRGIARLILLKLKDIPNSPVREEDLRFRIVAEKAEPAKKPSGSNNQSTIIDIIKILHKRPQTVSNLADELEIDADVCNSVIDKLASEGAIKINEDVEWDEPLYILDKDGYRDYAARVNSEQKNSSEAKAETPVVEAEAPVAEVEASVAKAEAPVAEAEAPVAEVEASVAKAEVIATSDVQQPVSDTAADDDNDIESLEDIVFKVISSSDKIKLNALVKKTDKTITRSDITVALKSLTESGKVLCSNPKASYPFYMVNPDAAKQKVPTRAKSNPTPAVEAQPSVKAQVSSDTSKRGPAHIQWKECLPEKEEVINDKTDVVNESATDFSSFAVVAALQVALADVMPLLSAQKQTQIEAAIAIIESDKVKQKQVISNLTSAINNAFSS